MTQPERRRRGRLAIGVAFTTAVASAMLAMPNATAAAPAQGAAEEGPGLGKHDQALLAKAEQQGKKTVKVLIATEEGAGNAAVDELARNGAKIEYRADNIGYVRAEVALDKVEKLAKLPGVAALDVSETIQLDNPRPEGQANPTPQTPPGSSTPRVNAYMPTGDIGSAQFVNDNPKWDGRGTTIAIVDSGVDLDHPALKTTTTGERKVVDWVTYTDPRFAGSNNLDDDPTWLLMSGSRDGAAVGLPAEGTLAYGQLNERDPRLAGEEGNDLNRDGNPAGSSGIFGVVWNKTTDTVWVDTDQDGTFSDEKAMQNYKLRYDIGTLGTDNPATPIKESMTFVVQTSPATNAVNIGIVAGAHGTHVAGITAANRMFGGTMTGAAPGAKIVSVRVCLFVTGCTSYALLEGMIYAAQNSDVINMSIGGLPALNDANNARAELYDRLIDETGVQMFISAGNSGAGMNTVGDPSVATKVVSVGSYITKETWQKNYGSDLGVAESLHGFSSRGPREDGGFKPQIIAPGSAISTVPTWQAGGPVAGVYALPPGYAMFNGTSMASPQAAGAAALLLSAAKAKGISAEPHQLRKAMMSTTRFVSGLQAYEQGTGLVDVKKAWNLLKSTPSDTVIESSVPVNTVLSGFLKTPGVGVGIYDREGVKAGDRYTRQYTFNRTTGPDSPVTYQVKWTGNDGTFSSPSTVTLRKNFPTKLTVTINPRTAGAHSAVLSLDSPTTSGVELFTMNTVVAAEQFSAANGYTIRKGGQIGRNESVAYFFSVPANTPAFKVDMVGGGTAAGAGQIRFLRFHPYGVGLDTNSSLNCYNPPVTPGGSCGGSPTSRTVANPLAGVWEVVVEARRTSDVAKAPYTLTASVLGATVTPNPDVIATAQIGVPVSRSYTLTNGFGTFTGKANGTTLGSAVREQKTIADLDASYFPVQVTAGTTSLRARIGGTSDASADLDLSVYRCPAPATTPVGCVLVGQTADGDSEEEVLLNNPAAGSYLVEVFAYAVPAGTTTYNYLDVFTNAAFGSVAVTDANAVRTAGASWTVPGVVTVNAAPAAGRQLVGTVEVRTDANVLVGSGDVVVQNVTAAS